VAIVICAITISVATRYNGTGSETPNPASVTVLKSQSYQFPRQRLLGNGLYWMSPVLITTFFQPPRTSVLAASAEVTAIHLASESWLGNRPPPSF
jgi:hypothetical protein